MLELLSASLRVQKPKHGGLQSVAVHNAVLLVEHDSGAPGFVLSDVEATRVETEEHTLVAQKLGQQSAPEILVRLQWVLGAVHEHRFLAGVPVDVRVAEDWLALFLLLDDLADQASQSSHFWVQLGVRLQKSAVQIVPAD